MALEKRLERLGVELSPLPGWQRQKEEEQHQGANQAVLPSLIDLVWADEAGHELEIRLYATVLPARLAPAHYRDCLFKLYDPRRGLPPKPIRLEWAEQEYGAEAGAYAAIPVCRAFSSKQMAFTT